MKHLLEYIAFLLLAVPLAALPVRAGELLGVALFHLLGRRRRITVSNIAEARRRGALLPDLDPAATARENFRNMGRSLSEAVKFYFGLGEGMVDALEIEGAENYERAKSAGKGVILITGHCGNWELFAAAFSRRLDRFCGVARRQKNPYFDRFINKIRERYGNTMVYKEGALRTFLRVLREGGTVGTVMDEKVRTGAVLVDFLGAPTPINRMPASLARRTGAAVVPGLIFRTPGGYRMKFYPALALDGDDEEDTGKMMGVIEDYVKQRPADWLQWFRKEWAA